MRSKAAFPQRPEEATSIHCPMTVFGKEPAVAGRVRLEDHGMRAMQSPKAETDRSHPGSLIVVGILATAVGLASFAVWFQWSQTKRCLAFFGPEIATAIQAAPRVEAWSLRPDGIDGRVFAVSRADVSKAPGLVHLRHGLVEDSNYAWSAAATGRRPSGSWDMALAFFAAGASRPTAVLAFDLEDDGAVTVVGRPGSVGLGRLGPGLKDWLTATLKASASGS